MTTRSPPSTSWSHSEFAAPFGGGSLYVSYRLQVHAHQFSEPLWPERNISLVLETLASTQHIP